MEPRRSVASPRVRRALPVSEPIPGIVLDEVVVTLVGTVEVEVVLL